MHLSPKERFGYVLLGAIVLTGVGVVLGQKLRRPATIELHETSQPPVSFDHGSSRERTQPPRTMETPAVSGQVIVQVVGAVNRPGLVELAPGSRVYEAIQAAGGPTEDANTEQVNLAAKAVDGSQVIVPHRGEQSVPGVPDPPKSGTRRSTGSKQPTGIIDINSADVSQFMTLPRIGAAMAQRIVDYRSQHGAFGSIDDLLSIQGFGKKRLDQIRQWVVAQ